MKAGAPRPFKPRTKPWGKSMQRVHAMLAGELLHSVAADPPPHLAGSPLARRMMALVPVVVELSKGLRKGEIKESPWKIFSRCFAIARRELSWPEGASPEEQERAWRAQIELVSSIVWTTEYMCPAWTHATPKATAGWMLLKKSMDAIAEELVAAHGEDHAAVAAEVSAKIWKILKRM